MNRKQITDERANTTKCERAGCWCEAVSMVISLFQIALNCDLLHLCQKTVITALNLLETKIHFGAKLNVHSEFVPSQQPK